MLKQIRPSWLALIVVVCAVARLSALIAFPSVFAFDQTGAVHGSAAYDTYARNLLATGVYGMTPGKADASVPPLYSYVLAGVYAIFGRGYMQVGLFHILLDVLSILMLVEISKHLFPNGQYVGLVAGLLYAVYPYLIFQNLTLIDTPFFMFLLHAFVLLMILLRERAVLDRVTWVIAVLGGTVLGASMLVRPIMPPLALLVAVWFLFRLNLVQTIARLLPVAVVGAVILIPWIVRNYGVYQAFVPMTTTSGANFWQGNSAYTVPYFRAGYDVQWTSPPDFNPTNLSEREADAQLFALALKYLRENPDKIPDLLWTKFLVQWSIDIAPRRNPVGGVLPRVDYQGNVLVGTDNNGGITLEGLPPGDPVAVYSDSVFDQVGRVVHRLYYGGLFVLALGGIALTVRQWRSVSLLWFVQIGMTIVYLIFHPSTRYRVPSDPMLFLFSAYMLIALWNYGKSRNVRWKQPAIHHDQPAA